MGFTLNIMTLLGMTLSVGLILDDAIVIRENIWSKIEHGMDAKSAALYGTKEVMLAVLATSLTVLAVFYPVTFIPGIVGRFFAAFAMTVCIGIVLSTFDAVTMAPMLSANIMRTQKIDHHAKDFFTVGWSRKLVCFFDESGKFQRKLFCHITAHCLNPRVMCASRFFLHEILNRTLFPGYMIAQDQWRIRF